MKLKKKDLHLHIPESTKIWVDVMVTDYVMQSKFLEVRLID